MPNKGEWSEPYAAIKILGDGKLYIADADGNKNPIEWMSVIELIRHETKDRIVTYRYKEDNVDIDIYVNGELRISVPASEFLSMADMLAIEIQAGNGNSFSIPMAVDFFKKIEMTRPKAISTNKSDVFLSVRDPRAGVIRNHIGFSIKSDFGQNPTLFNTAKSSAFIYKLHNMNDEKMNEVNSLMDIYKHVAIGDRCDWLLANNCKPTFVGLPIAQRAGCKAFQENLDLIDPRLITVIERMLWIRFFEHEDSCGLVTLMNIIIKRNPCEITRPEVKYPYMFKSFIYATYCGMTASTLWDGSSQVNGGFIKIDKNGEVLAHYALESDAFKNYLFNNCYLEFPSTDEKHGNYAKVYKENGEYYFRLNFQIRYR